MKKNLIYLMGVILALNFVACGDDNKTDDPVNEDPKWEEYVGVFGDKNILHINKKAVTGGTKTVTLEEGNGENATLILKNIFPEAAEVKLANVKVKEETGGFVFAVDTVIADSQYSIKASLTPGVMSKTTDQTKATLDLTYNCKITSLTVGTWNLNFTQQNEKNCADFIFTIATDDAGINFILPMMQAGIAQKIGEKVDAVQVNFSEDGTFTFQWRPVGTNKFETLPKEILAVIGIDFTYFTHKDKLYLSFPKEVGGVDIITLVAGFIGKQELAKVLKALLIEQSGYYLFPVNQTIEQKKGEFFIAEDMLSEIATVAETMIEGVDLGPFDGTVQPIVEALKVTKEAKLGLTFTKE